MNLGPNTTFTEFKADFYGKTKDLSLYDCGDINIIKVVLDGLKVNYTSKGVIRTPFFLPGPLWKLRQFVARKKNGSGRKLSKDPKVRVLFTDLSGRSETESNNTPLSYYFDKLLAQHAHGEYIHVAEHFKKKEYPRNIGLGEFLFLQYAPSNNTDDKLRNDLLVTFSRLRTSGLFDEAELANIKVAIQSFYNQYKIWSELLSHYPSLQYAVLEQHYHHEGLLLALKKRNIKSYEIQHGLISTSDIFYVFPKEIESIRSRALFPDKILTYGNYWKEVLLKGGEFSAAQVVVTGDFRSKNDSPQESAEKNKIDTFTKGNKIILISSQTFMHDAYISYAKWLSSLLSSHHPDWKIILKLHPNESEGLYAELLKLPNLLITKSNLLYLFKKASIHISVYSTTLFDALEYDVINYSLVLDTYKDYAENIIHDKIALPLQKDEDPVIKSNDGDSKTQAQAGHVYAPFSSETYKALFLN